MKFTALAFAALLLFAGCKKDKNQQTPTYQVLFKVDGTQQTFIPRLTSVQPNTTMPGKTDFMFVAASKDQKDNFAITIQVNGDFKAGSYSSGNTNYTVIADYFKNLGETNEKDYTIDNAPSMPNSTFTVNITEVSASLIKGSFTGNYLYDGLAKESRVINEGSFTLKLH